MVLNSGLKEMDMNHYARTFLHIFVNVELNFRQPLKPAKLQPEQKC
jgi:hypothetical protein